MNREELGRAIKNAAYLEGDFTLRSGKKSKYYIDKYRFETDPEILREVGVALAEHATDATSRIAGAELGGVALAAAASMASGLPFLIVRNRKKDYGTGNLFEGILEKGETVLLVEDIATTGGQVLEAAKDLAEYGANIEKIVAVVDRQQGARENVESAGFVFDALYTSEDLGIVMPQ
jgi:orotate phosphoribosyltransferase